MLAVIKLELRRTRQAFFSAAAVFLLSLPAAYLYSRMGSAPLSFQAALGGLLYFWAVPGVLLVAVLLGIYGGTQLCSSAREAEHPLPLPPGRHALAGLAAALSYSLIFAAIIWLMLWLTGHVAGLHARELYVLFAVPLAAALFYACVYSLDSGGGGLVAGAIVAAMLYAMFSEALEVQRVMGSAAADFAVMGALYALTFCGIIFMLRFRAETAGLMPKNWLLRNWGAAGILAGVLLLNMAALFAFRRSMANVLFPVPDSASFSLRSAPPEDGILLTSGRGVLALGKPSGGVEVFFSPTASEYAAFRYYVSYAAYGPDGSLWCLFRDGPDSSSGRYRIWRMSPQGKREFVASFVSSDRVDSLVFSGQNTLLLSWRGERMLAAQVPENGRVDWSDFTPAARRALAAEVVRAGFPDGGGALPPNVSLDADWSFYATFGGKKTAPIPTEILRTYMGENWRYRDWRNEGLQAVDVRGNVARLVFLRRHLVEADLASGREVSSARLPYTGLDCGSMPERYYARADGFFLSCGRYLYFTDWKGKSVRLGLRD